VLSLLVAFSAIVKSVMWTSSKSFVELNAGVFQSENATKATKVNGFGMWCLMVPEGTVRPLTLVYVSHVLLS
jgi:hypothetical protein